MAGAGVRAQGRDGARLVGAALPPGPRRDAPRRQRGGGKGRDGDGGEGWTVAAANDCRSCSMGWTAVGVLEIRSSC